MLNWIKDHFSTLHNLQLNTLITDLTGKKLSLEEGFGQFIDYVTSIRQTHGKLMFIGNGGSAGIASHLSIDYSKNGQLPAMTFTDASAITCLSNDYGYEYIYAKQIEYHARKNDILIAISSSGKSANIINGVTAARKVGCSVLTFSGFTEGNPLSKLGDVNLYIDSMEYGFVEVSHMALGHTILDFIIEQQCKQMSATLAAV